MNYPDIVFGLCPVGSEAIGNALARAVGFQGEGPAFGGEFGLGVRPVGSDQSEPVAWVHQAPARPVVRSLVTEYNGAGPFPLLNALGMTDQQVAAAKTVLTAEYFPRATHEYAFIEWLASKGYEIIPR